MSEQEGRIAPAFFIPQTKQKRVTEYEICSRNH